MFACDEDCLRLLADARVCLSSTGNERPLQLQTSCGNVLLYSAIKDGKTEDVKHLLKLGIPVHLKIKNKKPICLAVEYGRADIVNIFTRYGADVHDETNEGITFLHYAISKRYIDVIKALIDAGVDVNQKDRLGLQPLYRACELNDLDIAELLCDCGANIYTPDNVPLIHLAVTRRCIPAIHCISDLGLELNELDLSNVTPIYKAAKLGYLDIMHTLIENGVDLYARDSKGFTMLHNATRDGNLTAMKTLLDAGIDINVKGGWWGMTALHVAADTFQFYAAFFLIERKASTTVTTSDGKTPLSIAKSNGYTYMIDLLS